MECGIGGTTLVSSCHMLLAEYHCLLYVLQDIEFAFEKARLPEWIADIRKLIQKDLRSIPGWFAHRR